MRALIRRVAFTWAVVEGFSNEQINRAGATIRAYFNGEFGDVRFDDGTETSRKVDEAFEVMVAFRAAHQRPLIVATNGLRSTVRTQKCQDLEVSQRLKRGITIVNKLGREPKMLLSRMQDIAGCRAVLASIDEVRRVQTQLMRRRGYLTFKDYIVDPKSTGYRGIHVILRYNDCRVEVQLRTKVMHEWAITQELLGPQTGIDLKSGEAPPIVKEYFRDISEAMAVDERGEIIPEELLRTLQERRDEVFSILRRSQEELKNG
ncbi:MAG TPA: RelA/SpoT domain-containing protein [Acidimicrobiales bacterium]|nr:RelA/SpoT domain-containing protein [Acidimicrobiales bacterium]